MWFSHDEAHIISLFFVFFLSLFSFFFQSKKTDLLCCYPSSFDQLFCFHCILWEGVGIRVHLKSNTSGLFWPGKISKRLMRCSRGSKGVPAKEEKKNFFQAQLN